MTTVRIDDGDLAVDANGVVLTVTSLEEGSQSVARHILSEYDAFFDEGNELITFAFGASTLTLTDALVDQYLTEAVNRLIVIQENSGATDRIIKVNQIKTRLVGLTTLVFLIECLFESGEEITVVDQVNIRPVKLDHLIDPSSVIEV